MILTIASTQLCGLAITTCWETEEVLFFSELYPNVMDRKLKLDLRTSVTTALGA
jgi:hypothetical protein